jgi:hypothetical protein
MKPLRYRTQKIDVNFRSHAHVDARRVSQQVYCTEVANPKFVLPTAGCGENCPPFFLRAFRQVYNDSACSIVAARNVSSDVQWSYNGYAHYNGTVFDADSSECQTKVCTNPSTINQAKCATSLGAVRSNGDPLGLPSRPWQTANVGSYAFVCSLAIRPVAALFSITTLLLTVAVGLMWHSL